MRSAARKAWEEERRGLLRWLAIDPKTLQEEWQRAEETGTYYSHGWVHLHDALKLFALEENVLAEKELDFASRFIEEADKRDDCSTYGKRYDLIYEKEIAGKVVTMSAERDAAADGKEPWHDEDLGRALRTRMLLTCRWLKSGVREESLLKQIVAYMKAWLDFQYALPPDSPEANRTWDTTDVQLPKFVQWCVEAREYELDKEYFSKHSRHRLPIPPVNWNFTRQADDVSFLLAVHECGEQDLSQLFPEAMNRLYLWTCRQIMRGAVGYYVNEETLSLAYLRAKVMGLGTAPRELLKGIREDS